MRSSNYLRKKIIPLQYSPPIISSLPATPPLTHTHTHQKCGQKPNKFLFCSLLFAGNQANFYFPSTAKPSCPFFQTHWFPQRLIRSWLNWSSQATLCKQILSQSLYSKGNGNNLWSAWWPLNIMHSYQQRSVPHWLILLPKAVVHRAVSPPPPPPPNLPLPLLTPSLPQHVKFPGWEMYAHTCKEYSFRSCITSTFSAMRSDQKPFHTPVQKRR